MNGEELKALIDSLDPTGKIEISIDNKDIYFGEVTEAYWDGRLERLIIDDSKKPYYSIVGAKVVSSGKKLVLHTMGVKDVLMNDEDASVDLSDLETNMPTSYRDWSEKVENWRKSFKEIKESA
jgi:hypothetical protein